MAKGTLIKHLEGAVIASSRITLQVLMHSNRWEDGAGLQLDGMAKVVSEAFCNVRNPLEHYGTLCVGRPCGPNSPANCKATLQQSFQQCLSLRTNAKTSG